MQITQKGGMFILCVKLSGEDFTCASLICFILKSSHEASSYLIKRSLYYVMLKHELWFLLSCRKGGTGIKRSFQAIL